MIPLFAVPVQGRESDERYTPAWVFEHMGLVFDLDPCSPVGGGDCVPTRERFTTDDDGLAHDWHGLVWVNPPFSASSAFADRFIDHGNGVFLGPVANARWASDMLNAADLTWFCRDIAFTHPTHAGKRSNMPLMFCAMGERGEYGLRQLATSRVHPGCLMRRVA